MPAVLALVAAFCFALAAALQQRGQFALAHSGRGIKGLSGLTRLLVVPVWLLGTLVLLLGAGMVVVGPALFVLVADPGASIGEAAAHWRTWALLGFGSIALVVQQLSPARGRLAPGMAAVSVSNRAVSVILGIVLFEERLTRPDWHVLLAMAALLAALAGATIRTLADRDTELPGEPAPVDRARADPTPA